MGKSRNNVMTDYILSMEERIKKEPVMAVINSSEFFSEEDNITKYIIVQNTPENVEKFKNYIDNDDITHNVKVYYNDPDDYEFIMDGIFARAELKKERERQARLENPRVWRGVKDIETKEELMEYLVNHWYSTNNSRIWEYSSDLEVAEKELEVTNEELNKKIKEFL